MNSDYMFELQKNDILWESFHFEYLQQSLRSVLFYRNGSLIYVDKKEINCRSSKYLLNYVYTTEMININL